MSKLTAAKIRAITGIAAPAQNVQDFLKGVDEYGYLADLGDDAVLAQFLAQILHESGGLRYTKEIWGPTPAQKRYEGRRDLGNTRKGDGSKFRGYGFIQLTGRANVTAFYKWCVEKGLNPPNFLDKPELIAKAPWNFLSAVWFWDSRPKDMTRLARAGNLDAITRVINGGTNGLADRYDKYDRAALVLLGYGTSREQVKKFQRDHGLEDDGIIGDNTRMGLHKALGGTNPFKVQDVKTVTTTKAVPVSLASLEKPWYKSEGGVEKIATTVGGTGIVGLMTDIEWQKMAVIFGFLCAGGLVWYYIRRKNVAKQKLAAALVNAQEDTVEITEEAA